MGASITSSSVPLDIPEVKSSDNSIDDSEKNKVDTTIEEIEAFNVVKAILRQQFDVTRIAARDTQSYFGVLLDDNNRKPLCRLHFNAKQKYLGLFDESKKETRHPINSIDEIFNFSEVLLSSTACYLTQQ